jgi:hypothetical protein
MGSIDVLLERPDRAPRLLFSVRGPDGAVSALMAEAGGFRKAWQLCAFVGMDDEDPENV